MKYKYVVANRGLVAKLFRLPSGGVSMFMGESFTFEFEGRKYQTAHAFYLAKYLRVELELTTKRTNEIKG